MDTEIFWGWENPPAGLIAHRNLCDQFSNQPWGKLLVALGALNQQQLDDASQGPGLVDELKELESLYPNEVTPVINQAYAIKMGLPYTAEPIGVPHEAMESSDVATRCSDLRCVVFDSDHSHPVAWFGSIPHASKWMQMGRIEADKCPLRKLGVIPALASSASISAARQGNATTSDSHILKRIELDTSTAEGHRLLGELLDTSLVCGATNIDIALQPDGTGHVSQRVKRILQPHPAASQIAGKNYADLCNKLYTCSGAMNAPADPQEPIDGSFVYIANNGKRVVARLAVVPKPYLLGVNRRLASMSLRLRELSDNRLMDLEHLRISPPVIAMIRSVMRQKDGLCLVMGPMGAGKSSVIAAALNYSYELYGESLKRLSIENPVEVSIRGVDQYEVSAGTGVTSKSIAPSIVRMDANSVYMGEVRDPATAKLTTDMALLGIQVQATVHGVNILAGFKRMAMLTGGDLARTDLIEATRLALSLNLLPVLCSDCKQEITGPELLQQAADDLTAFCERSYWGKEVPSLTLYTRNPSGCGACQHSGISGLKPVVDALEFNTEVKTWLHQTPAPTGTELNAKLAHRAIDDIMEGLQSGSLSLEDVC